MGMQRLRGSFGPLVTRRSVLHGGIGGIAVAAGLSTGHRVGRAQDATPAPNLPRFDGETLRIFTFAGNPFIEGPVKAHAPEFEALTGAKLEIVTAPFNDLFTRAQQVAQTGAGDFDVLLLANTWVADFVNLGYVVALDDFIVADQADDLLAWDDIPDGIKTKNSWGGKTYAFIVDNDNQSMFYRKDVLTDPRWQEEFQAAAGRELAVPQTLTEFTEVARFFTGQDWGGDVEGDKYGFVTCVLRGAQLAWYCYPWTAPYTVVPRDKAPAQGIFLFDPDMNPLVNTEGFVRGIAEMVEAVKTAMRPGGDTDRGAVISEITNGHALMSFDWGDTGPASVASESVVKDKIGFAPTPGSAEYFDWQSGAWVTVDGVHRAPTHAFNGWSYFITSQAKNPDMAWAWLKFHASPGVSAIDVASPNSGMQPWRTSHSTNLTPWAEAGWAEDEARAYVETILAVTNDPNAVFDPRVPGADRYQKELELNLQRALLGEADPQAAMDDCANAFNDITEELGREDQIAAYHAHLGMS
jgi:multiple sugar transport system substrate-binding protein